MKITKTNKDVINRNHRKSLANEGCDKCPCCGETKELRFDYENGTTGIDSGMRRDWREGFFKPKHMRVDCYTCHTCGAEWESEPYEW